MFHPINKWNVGLGNALDVHLKITCVENFMNDKSEYVTREIKTYIEDW